MDIKQNDISVGLCPICNGSSNKVKELSIDFIRNKLSEHFNNQIDDQVEIIDYSLQKCNNCSFEYAFPFVSGSSSFYDWITSQEKYYPDGRWEYSEVLNDLTVNNNIHSKLLDVGCGDGNFLDFAKESKSKNVNFFGLDPTKQSVEKCLQKGHDVYCMDIEGFKSDHKDERFDAITAFHVLEHIAYPREFLKELASLLRPGGAVYLSTPYSPMDFEIDWFDILNHPPHHMGRWNLKSYRNLAETLELNVEFFMPNRSKLISSVIQSFMFALYGNLVKRTKSNILNSIIKNPIKFSSHLINQYKRDTVLGKRAANVIL